ncbi:hypothetical protein D3C71_290610 [compost metagenome]
MRRRAWSNNRSRACSRKHIDSFAESRYLLDELEQKVDAMRPVAFHIAAAVEREEDIPAR